MDRGFDYVFEVLLAMGMALLGWLRLADRTEIADMKAKLARVEDQVGEAKQSAVQVAFQAGKELAAHKLHAAETFATRDDTEERMDKMEERIVKRLDQLQASIADLKKQ